MAGEKKDGHPRKNQPSGPGEKCPGKRELHPNGSPLPVTSRRNALLKKKTIKKKIRRTRGNA